MHIHLHNYEKSALLCLQYVCHDKESDIYFI